MMQFIQMECNKLHQVHTYKIVFYNKENKKYLRRIYQVPFNRCKKVWIKHKRVQSSPHLQLVGLPFKSHPSIHPSIHTYSAPDVLQYTGYYVWVRTGWKLLWEMSKETCGQNDGGRCIGGRESKGERELLSVLLILWPARKYNEHFGSRLNTQYLKALLWCVYIALVSNTMPDKFSSQNRTLSTLYC